MASLIVYISVGLASLDAEFHSTVAYNGLGVLILASALGTICTGIAIAILDVMCKANKRKLDTAINNALVDVLMAIRKRIHERVEEQHKDDSGAHMARRDRLQAWLNSLTTMDQLAQICNDPHELALIRSLGSVDGSFQPSRLWNALFPELFCAETSLRRRISSRPRYFCLMRGTRIDATLTYSAAYNVVCDAACTVCP